ncbi:MAG: hypothetical protein HKN22_00720 [Bacteroidia bacterium]|nr:hypothetical protein [Bacteroidia bacterium]
MATKKTAAKKKTTAKKAAVKKTAAKKTTTAVKKAATKKKASVTTKAKTATKAKRATRKKKVEEPVVPKVVKPPKPFVIDITKSKDQLTIEDKLIVLYQLQRIDSQIDRIKTIRGELPMEVSDLEDEIAGLETRITNYKDECASLEEEINNKKLVIKEANAAIKKYQAQQMNVKNNREFDSLNKEMEFQQLEIQLAEKRIKEHGFALENKKEELAAAEVKFKERNEDLSTKKGELESIIAETEKEEKELNANSKKADDKLEGRLLEAYKRIRENARNGLAVVSIERSACGGCFNKIPPQRQLEIRQRKKIIVCEHCGRVLVDPDIDE